jgi:hypothetical protein
MAIVAGVTMLLLLAAGAGVGKILLKMHPLNVIAGATASGSSSKGGRATARGDSARSGHAQSASLVHTNCSAPKAPATPLLGVAVLHPKTAGATVFKTETGIAPRIVELYAKFGAGFKAPFICSITRLGALPLIQINPRTTPLAGIVSGQDDAYLRRYAHSVSRFKLPVALSFGHEMNGNWYPWGYTHVRPRTFVAAWRHIYDVFRKAGTKNVIWVWTCARQGKPQNVSPARLWWPGNQYVTWVGINGKYGTPTSNFAYVFGKSITLVRHYTPKPILLSEMGILRGAQRPAQLRNLFAALSAHPKVLGMVWFNAKSVNGNWALQSDPASETTFRRAALHYLKTHRGGPVTASG